MTKWSPSNTLGEMSTAISPATAPVEAWHALHLVARIDGPLPSDARAALAAAASGGAGVSGKTGDGIARSVAWAVLGARADVAVCLFAPDARDLFAFQRRLFGAGGLTRVFGFVSLTEVSEYVPKERRTPELVENRLHPEIPDLPNVCFYPMSKRRGAERNWYRLSFEKREELMRGHGTAARKFVGRVEQIITTAAGLDDWEWGVTLFGRRPEDIRDCVYELRYDEVSAEYAEFGPFFYGPRLSAEEVEAL